MFAFEALINCLVFFRYFLCLANCFLRLQLSRSFCICLMSGENQYGRRLVLTRLFLIGACLFNCCMINAEKTAISATTVSWSFYRCFQVIGKFCEKINFIKVFETAIRSYIVIIFWDYTIDFASEANGEMVTY